MESEKQQHHTMRMAEKWKAKKYEYQERHKGTLCKVYFATLIVTVGLAFYTYTNAMEGKPCADSWVRDSLWLVLLMHGTNILQQVCAITGLENFFCSGICNLCLDIYEIGILIFMMNQLTDSTHCLADPETSSVYYCLLVNAIVYWIFFLISWFTKIHSFCSGPSQEEIDTELKKEEDFHNKNKMQ